MAIHIGKTPSREGWIGFETDPHLLRTKENLRAHCLPCMTALYDALREGAAEVELTHAWDCWKVTAVLVSDEECREVLSAFGELFPDAEVQGKFGGSVGRETSAVIFHMRDEAARDNVEAMLKAALAAVRPDAEVFISRGCANPYEKLLGPWRDWTRVSKIAKTDAVEGVRKALRDSLYRNS